MASRRVRVSCVAFHPKALMLAVGFEDGWVMLSRLLDGGEMLVYRPDEARDAISAMAWSADGNRLLFGSAGGALGCSPCRLNLWTGGSVTTLLSNAIW